MAAASATVSPITAAVLSPGRSSRGRTSKVIYIKGLNTFSGLKAQNSVTNLGLPVSADYAYAKLVCSLRNQTNGSGGLSAKCNAAGEIFRIAAVMNGLTLVGVAIGFVLLRIEAAVEESE